MKKGFKWIASILFAVTLLFSGTSFNQSMSTTQAATRVASGPTDFAGIIAYIKANGSLPSNFVTKDEAQDLGWNSSKCNLATVAPGKSIGGDVFSNREKKLPAAKGRIWYEADANYTSGCRGAYRVLFSNDGLYYTTSDHYQTFQKR